MHINTHTYFGGMKVISRNQAHTGLWPARAWFNSFTPHVIRSMGHLDWNYHFKLIAL